jgi:hypothetical protein
MIRRLWRWFADGKEVRPHPWPDWETYDAADFDLGAGSDIVVWGIAAETDGGWARIDLSMPVVGTGGEFTVEWNESGIFAINTPDPGDLYDDWEHTPRPEPDPWPPGKPRPLP